eukprot:scaffold6860_cov297-Chaetoceros_neogracile.AAC.45
MITPEDPDATTAINHIPADICRQIADFLEVFDAVSFKITCNSMKDAISLGILHDSFPALQDLRAHGGNGGYHTSVTSVVCPSVLGTQRRPSVYHTTVAVNDGSRQEGKDDECQLILKC